MIKSPPTHSIYPFCQRLSPRTLKVIIAGVLICIAGAFLALWQPAYMRLGSLQEEKAYWQDVRRKGMTQPNTIIPTMDQLPDMIELCRHTFADVGVDVVSLNVERFGERREAGKGARIDYALVNLRLLGQWPGIVTSLAALEKMQGISIHVQEAVLSEAGGEAILQIYYCTGE
ncbi:hypothetical protein [Desulfosporosinus lacus]|uniref:Uncharacterized protein n=1 Tax=Desulfosporosinus lacus DSM 15449 TaxID=1121420 RepID=A0A1M5YZX2_9FIRM|nr:hypothetical protein [Desulfosporosinus lacus]SHI17509.1 hypothetical protein SAMN02746098_02801 [Desulfosporosinus lacus DSM 15449]